MTVEREPRIAMVEGAAANHLKLAAAGMSQ